MGLFSRLFGRRRAGRRVVRRRASPMARRTRAMQPRPSQLPAERIEQAASPASVEVQEQTVIVLPQAEAGYFEVARPDGDGRCAGEACPSAADAIPRGGGYLYISQQVVDFRRNARSLSESLAKQGRIRLQMSDMFDAMAVMFGHTGAVLLCEQCARRLNLDLDVAAADARQWWQSGTAPLRATPQAKPAVDKPPTADKPQSVAEPRTVAVARKKVVKKGPVARKGTVARKAAARQPVRRKGR